MIIVDQDHALPQKRQLCHYYFIIIDQVDILFGDRLTVTIHGGDINIHASRNLYTEKSCIAESCIVKSWIAEIVHRESIIMHDEKISCLVKIYTSREEFMPRWNSCIAESCIAEIMHRESIIMHDEKISCLVKIYTSREEFMPRWNSCIAESCIASQ